ncbi:MULTISPECIES: FAD-dependent oxidoreductase [unclassified Serratia (in: enterobacteria)]|uniref:FAD-dependent oxidoreductase n=1 Tax=unclassified Serratia (in: enterobacteria) TaxID=2647522 RepID=UPI00068E1552|nr:MULTISPECIES: FAD-dependent oxidoreductase [unclassified Serratia (in: enterobacteria)]
MQPETRNYDLVIVGAGPAGLTAALQADKAGLHVAVVDEQAASGGQIFRQPPATFKAPLSSAFTSYPFGKELLEQARSNTRIQWYYSSIAWGVFHPVKGGVQLAIFQQEQTYLLEGRKLLIATGAYDLPVALPGWTLPGVMSAGGVQTLLKSQFLCSAQRYVLAGSHPLLLLLAEQLLDAGVQIQEIAIARPRPQLREILAGWRALPDHWRLFFQLTGIFFKLWHKRVPLRFSTLLTRVEGKDRVERVTLTDVDSCWAPIPDTERSLKVDGVAIGYGLLASTELARQAGCQVNWQPERGGWVVKHDEEMRTSMEHIYVAGEPAGVSGAEVAHCQGQLAALSIIALLKSDAATEVVAARRALRRAQPFADTVAAFFAPRLDALARLATNETLICRCEDVTAGQVSEFLQAHPHVTSINSVKLACRSGMGPCQGRYCQHTVAHLVAAERDIAVNQTGIYTAQAPIKPIPLTSLVSNQPESPLPTDKNQNMIMRQKP